MSEWLKKRWKGLPIKNKARSYPYNFRHGYFFQNFLLLNYFESLINIEPKLKIHHDFEKTFSHTEKLPDIKSTILSSQRDVD